MVTVVAVMFPSSAAERSKPPVAAPRLTATPVLAGVKVTLPVPALIEARSTSVPVMLTAAFTVVRASLRLTSAFALSVKAEAPVATIPPPAAATVMLPALEMTLTWPLMVSISVIVASVSLLILIVPFCPVMLAEPDMVNAPVEVLWPALKVMPFEPEAVTLALRRMLSPAFRVIAPLLLITSELIFRSALAFEPAAFRLTRPPVALTPVISPTEEEMVTTFSPFAVSAILMPPVPVFTTATLLMVVSRLTVPFARIPSELTPVRSVPALPFTLPAVKRMRVLTLFRVVRVSRLMLPPSVRPISSVPAVNSPSSVSLNSIAPAVPPSPIVSDI